MSRNYNNMVPSMAPNHMVEHTRTDNPWSLGSATDWSTLDSKNLEQHTENKKHRTRNSRDPNKPALTVTMVAERSRNRRRRQRHRQLSPPGARKKIQWNGSQRCQETKTSVSLTTMQQDIWISGGSKPSPWIPRPPVVTRRTRKQCNYSSRMQYKQRELPPTELHYAIVRSVIDALDMDAFE